MNQLLKETSNFKDSYYSLFEIVFDSSSKNDKQLPQVFGILEGFHLEYHLNWPLTLLLTPQALVTYNSIFLFLVRLKMVQLELQDCWKMGSQDKQKRQTKLLHKFHFLRHKMSSLISTLQQFYSLTVHQLWEDFVKQKPTVQNFTHLQTQHQSLLDQLSLL